MNPGEIIPLDGVCQEEGSLYNLLITGDPIPRRFQLNEPVLAGMQVSGHANSIKIRVSKTTQNSYLARLDEGIAKSISEKAPIELKTNRYLAYFIPTVIGLSIISGILIGLFFTPALAIQCAISVLVSACPCTLGLITPLAVKTGMNKATEHGVQFKNATVLEQAEQIDVVVFDLNGTLTTGIPEIKSTMILNDTGLSLEALKNICSALEKDATHPIGKAIYSFSEKNCTKQLEITGIVDQSHHAGRSAQINDEQYTIGSKSLMHYKNISTEELEHQLNLSAGDSVVFIARNDTLVGYFIITDPLRPDAAATIKALTQMGKKIHLCTGADEATALRYANILGIREVHANYVATHSELNDKSKPAYINSLKLSKLKVAMVGDAANDAPAMSNCDFGIAVVSHNSDAITQKTAGAIIHKGTLLPIASAFAISQQTVSNIKQNLIMSLSYNLMAVLASGGLLVAIGISLNPGVCVALMAIQACIILLNVYRFKYQALTHLQEEPGLSQKTVIDDLSSYSQIDKSAPKQTHQNQTHNVPTETQPIQTGNIPRTSFFKSGIPTQDNEYPKPLIRLF